MSNATTKYQIVDTNIQTLGQMIQRGNVVIDGILQQETWNTTIDINRQLIVKTTAVSPIFPMLVSPTEITMVARYMLIHPMLHLASFTILQEQMQT